MTVWAGPTTSSTHAQSTSISGITSFAHTSRMVHSSSATVRRMTMWRMHSRSHYLAQDSRSLGRWWDSVPLEGECWKKRVSCDNERDRQTDEPMTGEVGPMSKSYFTPRNANILIVFSFTIKNLSSSNEHLSPWYRRLRCELLFPDTLELRAYD